MSTTGVLLRDGTHTGASTRYGLKAEQVAVSIVKTPIQIPIPKNSPALIDIGIFRPSITISGLVDTVGASQNISSTGNEGMTSFNVTVEGATETYYIPYKNKLEEAAYKWLAQDSTPLELQIGDAVYPIYNLTAYGSTASGSPTTAHLATGGAIYQVAIQQFRVQVDASKEDRWQYTFQFVTKARTGVSFSG